jgi:hypothetical protein
MHVIYITTTCDRGRFEFFVSLSFSLPDKSRFRFLHSKGLALGEGFVLCDDAEEKSESEFESDELDDLTVTRRRWTIIMTEEYSLTFVRHYCNRRY